LRVPETVLPVAVEVNLTVPVLAVKVPRLLHEPAVLKTSEPPFRVAPLSMVTDWTAAVATSTVIVWVEVISTLSEVVGTWPQVQLLELFQLPAPPA
jgi:hypothetical protein